MAVRIALDSGLRRNDGLTSNAGTAAGKANDLLIRRLGQVDYEPTWRAMQAFTATRTADTPDEVWLLQHPPVFTLGQAGRREHVLADIGIPIVAIDRGGQVTYHGPGQVVVYLLIDLRRRGYGVKELVRRMEQAVIDLLADVSVNDLPLFQRGNEGDSGQDAMGNATQIPPAPLLQRGEPPATALSSTTMANIAGKQPAGRLIGERLDGAPGVYVGGAKIAALGLRVKHGCSYHGLALNVDMDLAPFGAINPCGYPGMAVTQLHDLGVAVAPEQVGERLLACLLRLL